MRQLERCAELDFRQAYAIVSETKFASELTYPRRILSAKELSEILKEHGADLVVKEKASRLSEGTWCHEKDEQRASVDCEKVIAVHRFMFEEVSKFIEDFKRAPGVFYDFNTARMATGVAILIKIEEHFQLKQHDLNQAVAKYGASLSQNEGFTELTRRLSALLSEFDEP